MAAQSLARASDITTGESVTLEFDAWESDPLGRLLIGRLNLSPVKFGIIAVIASALQFGISFLAAAFSSATTEEVFPDNVWAIVGFGFVVFPLAAGFYIWISRATGRLFADIQRQSVIDAPEKVLGEAILGSEPRSVRSIQTSRVWMVAAIVVTLLGISGWVAEGFDNGSFADKRLLFNILGIPLILIGYYALSMLAARQFGILYSLWRVFHRFSLRIRPFHPDRCGGLGALGQYAVSFGYFLFVAGLGLSLVSIPILIHGHFADSYTIYVAIAAYAVVAPLTFFLTLGAAHRAMADSKDRWMKRIADQIETDYVAAVTALNKGEVISNEQLEKVSQMHSLYRTTQAFPVWPFDTATIGRFVSILAAPLITVGATAIVVSLFGQ